MFLFLLFCIDFASAAYHLPSGLHLCHRSSPDFTDCVRQHMDEGIRVFSKGYPDLGVPCLEPYRIEKLEFNNDGARAASVKQKYWNLDVYGMTGSHVKHLVIDLDDKCFWNASTYTPMVRLEGDYQLQGKLLIFPVNGQGRCNVTLYHLHNHHHMACERFTKRGRTYIRVIDYKMTIEAKKLTYDLTNLIPGNPEISKQVIKTLNENANTIFQEVRPGYEDVFSKIHADNANQVFSRIPMDQIFLK